MADFHEQWRDFQKRIERELAQFDQRLEQELAKRVALLGRQQNPRLARTIANPTATPTYPVQGIGSAKAFPIVFQSGGFLLTATNQSAQYVDHRATPQTHVYSTTHNYIPVNTTIEVWQDRGNDPGYKGEWWTAFRDPVRIGITTSAIANMANGTVDEYEPNDYSEETVVIQSWLCRNWCGYDLASHTPCFFSQRKGVAYILNAACEASGSGFGSGA